MIRRSFARMARVACSVALIATMIVARSSLPVVGASTNGAASTQCSDLVDMTDNGRDLWALCWGPSNDASHVVEIDDQSGTIVRDVLPPSGFVAPPEIVANDHYVWILDAANANQTWLAQYSAPSGRFVRELVGYSNLPVGQPTSIAATPGSLWVGDEGEHRIVEISASTSHVLHISPLAAGAQPMAMSASSNSVWALYQAQSDRGEFGNYLEELNISGTVIRRITLALQGNDGKETGVLTYPSGLTATPTGVWVYSPLSGAIEIDAASGHVQKRVRNLPYLGQQAGKNMLAITGDRLWLAGSDPALTEFNTTTGNEVASVGSGQFSNLGTYGIAADSKFVWVMNSSVGRLARFRSSNGSIVRSYFPLS